MGDDSGGSIQNDVAALLSNNPGIGGFVEDGIGHTMATATPMPVTGTTVNAALAKGIITPVSTSDPTPIGTSNYTTDYFKFHSEGGMVSLTAYNGSEFITPGTADPGATLRSVLTILTASGSIVGTATEASSTLSETFSRVLAHGDYYAKIESYGGHAQTLTVGGITYNTTEYFDMGSYFLKGSGITRCRNRGHWPCWRRSYALASSFSAATVHGSGRQRRHSERSEESRLSRDCTRDSSLRSE